MNESLMPIGGYFELELAQGKEYHIDAVRVNNARNALDLIIKLYGYKKILIPYYTCHVMLEPLVKNGCKYEFYAIDDEFMPISIPDYDDDTAFLYTNYFGICDIQVRKCVDRYKNIIVDNSQAFFSLALQDIPTFYSARKFFGVPDGAYLYMSKEMVARVPRLLEPRTYHSCSHLLKRIDLSPEDGYQDSVDNDLSMTGRELNGMSKLSVRILESIDYQAVIKRRRANFQVVHQELGMHNELNLDNMDLQRNVPLSYPFLFNYASLKRLLSEKRIYIPTYWVNVLTWAPHDSREFYLAKNLAALPIDQRYNSLVMRRMCKIVRSLVDF